LARKGRYVLLIVDEAHLLPPELFDQLRFLLNDQMDSTSLITLVLLGQPDLAHKLRFAPYCYRPNSLTEMEPILAK
jgi:general secretion pathway protein A